MTGRIFIGVDGGGSKTTARIRDESGRLLGEGSAGPGNARLGDRAFSEIMRACQAAAATARVAELSVLHAGLGLAGTQQDPDRDAIRDRPWPFAAVTVDTDAYTSWLGAFGGRDGAILILGTGSGGLAMVDGRRINVGGWGADNGDEGGGMASDRIVVEGFD